MIISWLSKHATLAVWPFRFAMLLITCAPSYRPLYSHRMVILHFLEEIMNTRARARSSASIKREKRSDTSSNLDISKNDRNLWGERQENSKKCRVENGCTILRSNSVCREIREEPEKSQSSSRYRENAARTYPRNASIDNAANVRGSVNTISLINYLLISSIADRDQTSIASAHGSNTRKELFVRTNTHGLL